MSSVAFRDITISREDVLRAMAVFDQQYPVSFKYGGWDDPGNQHYFIRIDGRAYPPRFILSLSTGMDPELFAVECLTYRVFEELGFEVLDLTLHQPWRYTLAGNTDETNLAKHPISSLGLSVRSYNGLARRGITTIAQLAAMSDEDLFRIRNLGQKSIDEIHLGLSDYLLTHPLVQGQTFGRIPSLENGDGNLPHLSGEHIDLSDLHLSVVETDDDGTKPKPDEPAEEPDGQETPISVLDLSVRVHNALARSDIKTVGQLARMSDEDLFTVRNLGAKSIGDIQARLDAYLELHPLQPLQDSATPNPKPPLRNLIENAPPLVDEDLRARTRHIPLTEIPIARLALSPDVEDKIRKAGIRSIGDLLVNTSVSFRPNTLSEVQERTKQYLEWLLAQDSDIWEGEITNWDISPLYRLDLEGTTIEALVTEWLSFLSDRHQLVLRRRFGLDIRVLTLEEVGQEMGLTRERVRQLEKQALKALSTPARRKQLIPVIAMLRQTLEDHGGVMRSRTLMASLRRANGIEIGSINPMGFLRLVAELSGEVAVAERQRIVFLTSCSPDAINAVQQDLVRTLDACATPLSERSLLRRFKRTDLYQGSSWKLTDKLVIACLRSSNQIERTDKGLFGLRKASWKRKSTLIKAMRQISEPAHFSVITAHFNELVPEKRRLSEHNLHAYLGRFPNRFARVGHGVYGLTEWGLGNDGKVANTAYWVLRDAGRPLHIDAVTQKVLKTWHVNPGSVLAAVETDDRFIRIGRGVYDLREHANSDANSETQIDFGDVFGDKLEHWQEELDQRKPSSSCDAQSEVDAIRSFGSDFFND